MATSFSILASQRFISGLSILFHWSICPPLFKVLVNDLWKQFMHCCSVVSYCWQACVLQQTRLPVLHYLQEFAQSHVHWVDDAIQPSHPLLPLVLLPPIFPSIRGFSNESALCIRWPKYWSFTFSFSPSHEYSGLISFRIDCLISLESKGLSRIFSSIAVQKHQFFGAQPSLWSNSHICTWYWEKYSFD